ncbi:MAG: AAA family ATPase [Lachnospiraceae bacterium]|nr:AAA family ATPase [Lachnospiraceae bacterium]
MKIESVRIKNYKAIKDIAINSMENACILVGKNSTGKSAILDAIMVSFGYKSLEFKNFKDPNRNIEISVRLSVAEEDLDYLWKTGSVSRFKKRELFIKDFEERFPSYKEGVLFFEFQANKDGTVRYNDGFSKNNEDIPRILPKIYYIDHRRDIDEIERDIIQSGIRENTTNLLLENRCMFDPTRNCNACFNCIGKIEKKEVSDLSIFETEKLLEYKIYHADNEDFMNRLNRCFNRNSGLSDLLVDHINVDAASMMEPHIVRYKEDSDTYESVHDMSEGMKSIYILSLLEAYLLGEERLPCILMMEDPELFLHPELQKTASELLYKLSQKNQTIFSTHAPTMLFNFNRAQIKQIQLGKDKLPVVREHNDLGRILDDLGYSANDLMNVSFVFIVEGKQDKNRLPLLLNKYYSEIQNESGELNRIAVIATNSCTNIKTYANLKYINQLYIRDQFLMIRDGDGKDPERLKRELCSYYDDRIREDNVIPRVTPDNVLILKYYSFENYFLNPDIMAKIGVVESREAFFDIFYSKYREYLYKIKSFVYLREKKKIEIKSPKDIEDNLETILTYVRGHNLFDIFYGRYKGKKENDILKAYIDNANREVFKDILDSIDRFVFFENKKKR